MLNFLTMGTFLELFDDSRTASGNTPWADGDADRATEMFIEKGYAFIKIYIPLALTSNWSFFR